MTPEQIDKELKRLWKAICCNSGSSTFVGLTDGPGDFTGQAGESVRVNVTEDALEYFTITPTSASNGLSINSISGDIVLGQDVGEVGNPAILTSNREIPDGGFTTYTTGAGRRYFGQRAVEGTNFNFFDAANILTYSEATLAGHIGPKNFAAYRYVHLENGDSIGSYSNIFTSSVFRIKGTTTLTGSDLTSVGFNMLFSRATSGFGSPLIVNAPTVPTSPATNQRLITGATNAGAITYNGFYSGTDYRLQLNTGTHTMQSYSDIILGNSVISGGSTVTTRYGLYINPIKQSFVTTGYSIFQEGTTDINHLAGVLMLTNLPTYADEAAAVTGGLATNTVYKTATGELRIKL